MQEPLHSVDSESLQLRTLQLKSVLSKHGISRRVEQFLAFRKDQDIKNMLEDMTKIQAKL